MQVDREINRYLAILEKSDGKRVPEAMHQNMMDYYFFLSSNLLALVPGQLEHYKKLTIAMGQWYSFLCATATWADEREEQRRDLGRALCARYQRLFALGEKRTQAQAEEFERLNVAYRRRLGALLGHYLSGPDMTECRQVAEALGYPIEVKRFDLADVAFNYAGQQLAGVAI